MDQFTSNGEQGGRVIVAATDFSGAADEALRQAHVWAKSDGATLVVCHVVPNLTAVNLLFPQRGQEQTAMRLVVHQQARRALIERTCEITGRTESEFQSVVDDGAPYACIVEHAERLHADLIVVGDRGATGVRRMLLGSVAERVVRYAHAPVLVARAGERTAKILVATDLSDASLPAVGAGAREVGRTGAHLTVMHCIEPVAFVTGPEPGVVLLPPMTPEIMREARERAQERLAEALRQFDLQGDVRVVEGFPAATILATAEEIGAELVILGTRGRTGLRRVVLGSVAEMVVRHAHCSVLVVRLFEAGTEAVPDWNSWK